MKLLRNNCFFSSIADRSLVACLWRLWSCINFVCLSMDGIGISNPSRTDFGIEGTVDPEKNPLRYDRFWDWFNMSDRNSGIKTPQVNRITKKVEDATQGPKSSLYTVAKLLVHFATKRMSLGLSKCLSLTSCSRSGTRTPSFKSPLSSKCFACKYTTLPSASVWRKYPDWIDATSPIFLFKWKITE